MSDQSDTGVEQNAQVSAPDGSDAGGAALGVESRSEPPEWLGPIYDRMDELTGQQAQLVEALQYGYDEYGEYDDGDTHGDAALSDEELAELSEIDAAVESGQFDAIDLIGQSVESRLDQREAVERSEEAWDDLREELPFLQDDKVARQVVDAAMTTAQRWGFDPIDGDRMVMVKLIEQAALAHIGREALTRQNSGQNGHGPPARSRQGRASEVQLESASGAAQETATGDVDWGARIVAAAEKIRPRI